MSKKKRYLQWGYDSFKDTKTGEISDNHIHLLNKQAEQISDLEAKLAESERLAFTYQNIFRQKPETATEMYEFIQPYERELRKNELEIDQLKQQLAEKDKAIENWQTMYESVVQTCHNDKEEIERLNKLFAEKEKEIECLTTDLQKALALIKEGREIVDLNNKALDLTNQDKISFALEQLEKVKGKIQHNILFVDCDDYVNVLEEIDNQINQLTHQHEDKGN